MIDITFTDGSKGVINADGIIELTNELCVDIGRAKMLNEIAQRDIERIDEWQRSKDDERTK